MKGIFDIIVIGLGAMGAAALWRLAPKCTRTLGIEASGPTHSYGSSQGESRIFRRAYWEGEKYLPLLNHANLLWNELEKSTQRKLIFRTGGIFIGHESSRVVAGSIKTANQAGIEHAVWSGAKTGKIFPGFEIHDGMRTVFEPGAYAISACDARLAMLNEAIRFGAIAQFGDGVVTLENHRSGVRATTVSGRRYIAKSAIITAGPWIGEHFTRYIKRCLEPRHVPIYWFKPKNNYERLFTPDQFPVFLYECRDESLLYGVPSIHSNELGVKIGYHNRQQTVATPDWKDVPVKQIYLEEISTAVESLFPKLERSPIKAKNCFYTMSPDESFLIEKHRTLNSTYFASVCSGHGFKFATAIGDALAHMALGQEPPVSLSAFSSDRFGSAPQ